MKNLKTKNQSKSLKCFLMKEFSPFMRITSLILILAFLNLFTGCMNYFKVAHSPDHSSTKINNLYQENKELIIHYNNEAWIMEVPEVNDNILTAVAKKSYISSLTHPVKKNGSNRFIIKAPYNQYNVLNEVHIYTTDLTRNSDDVIKVPLDSINNVEIYEFDKTATDASYFLGVVGGTVASSLAGFLILAAIASCPFIYVPVDDNYVLVGEIYSGSVYPPLERHDYLKLPNQTTENNSFQLKISNELKEKQHTNLLELWVFNHDKNTEILVDKYGQAHTLKNTLSPISATNLENQEILDKVAKVDDKFYTSTQYTGEIALTDGVIAEFQTPENSEYANVKIRAKNDVILDYMLGEFYDEIGDLYKPWNRLQKRAPEEKQRNWTLNQNIPLKLSVEKNGNWEYIDYYHVVGPVAMKEDILSFHLDGTESNPLKIKLEYGNFFWDIDYVGVDFSNNENVDYQIVSVDNALDQDNKSVKKKLTSDDNRYYSQNFTGTYALVDFTIPEKSQDQQTIYLHSKGWYETLRNPIRNA